MRPVATMKNAMLIAGLLAGVAAASVAPRVFADAPRSRQHRVVFEVTTDDPRAWEGILDNVENVRKALGPTSVEIVAHGKGLAMLTRAKSAPLSRRLEQAAGDGVVFAACENSMRKQDVKPDELVPYARTVDSGVAELVRKQESGWSYLRSAP